MSNYWLCVTRERNWERIKRLRIWGVSETKRRIIEQVKPGDILVFYITPKKLGGSFRVISKPYVDNTPIFVSEEGETYPLRVKIEPLIVPSQPKDFTPLIKCLSITKGKRVWHIILRGTMIRLQRDDYEIIERYLEENNL